MFIYLSLIRWNNFILVHVAKSVWIAREGGEGGKWKIEWDIYLLLCYTQGGDKNTMPSNGENYYNDIFKEQFLKMA